MESDFWSEEGESRKQLKRKGFHAGGVEWPDRARKLPGGGKLLRFWMGVGSYFENGKWDPLVTWNRQILVPRGTF